MGGGDRQGRVPQPAEAEGCRDWGVQAEGDRASAHEKRADRGKDQLLLQGIPETGRVVEIGVNSKGQVLYSFLKLLLHL